MLYSVYPQRRASPATTSPRNCRNSATGSFLEAAIKGAGPIDVVDVFRAPEHVPAIVDEAIRLRVPALWLQEGVIDEVAAQRARDAGIFTVMDRCLYKARRALGA